MDWKQIDEQIVDGYDALQDAQTQKGCTILLSTWDLLKGLMAERHFKSVYQLDDAYRWTEVPSNMVQDLELGLREAAKEDEVNAPDWHWKRIHFCEDLLTCLDPVGSSFEGLTVENTRRAIAESHADMGNLGKADSLLSDWIAASPDWGWGYIARADLYLYKKDRTDTDLAHALSLLEQASKLHVVRDREDILERLGDVYGVHGDEQEMNRFHQESEKLRNQAIGTGHVHGPDCHHDHDTGHVHGPDCHHDHDTGHVHGPDCHHDHGHAHAHAIPASQPYDMKPGRNDPCPCGSGKKYKKCCGK